MTEQTGQGASPAESTKHSTTIHARNGRDVCLTRDLVDGLTALTITATNNGGAQLTAYVHAHELRRLLELDRGESCLSCKFSRLDPDGRRLRCHAMLPRRSSNAAQFPEMSRTSWCGKFKPLEVTASRVAP